MMPIQYLKSLKSEEKNNPLRHYFLAWKSAVIKDPLIQKEPGIIFYVFEDFQILNGYHQVVETKRAQNFPSQSRIEY